MKISITTFDDEKIVLTNDDMDNYNFVDVVIGDKECTVSIDDLLAGITAFHTLRKTEDDRTDAFERQGL